MPVGRLPRFRPEFPILETSTYLISNSLGAMPRATAAALAEYAGFRSATARDPERRGGAVSVDFENALEVARELNARDVVVDYRPGAGIRISPHFYTEDTELDRAFTAIDEILSSGAWRRWRDRPALVT